MKVLAIDATQRKTGRHAGRWDVYVRLLIDGEPARFTLLASTEEAAMTKAFAKVEKIRTTPPDPEPVAEPTVVSVADVGTSWVKYTLPTLPTVKSPSTRDLYASTVERDLVPAIGTVEVASLTARDVEVLLAARAHQSGSTRRRILTVLRFVLDSAQRDGHITVNVARLVARPAADKPKPKALERSQAEAIDKAMTDERLEPVFTTLAWLGCRIGELLALAAADVQLDGPEPHVFIRGSLARVKGEGLILTDGKSDKARRVIPLTPEAVAAVKRWRARQAAERLKAGPLWVQTDYLFTSQRGTPMDPHNVAAKFRKLAKAAEVKASPHRLRHTLATDLLANGVSLREVQEILGHASPMTTAAMYQTVTPAHKRATMDRLSQIRKTS